MDVKLEKLENDINDLKDHALNVTDYLGKQVLNNLIEMKELEKALYLKSRRLFLEWCNITDCSDCICYKIANKCLTTDHVDLFNIIDLEATPVGSEVTG